VHVQAGVWRERLPDALCDELRLEYPRFSGATFAEERVLLQGRAFRALGRTLGSEEFLARAAELTGIEGLSHDPEFTGAGLRAARTGTLPGWRRDHQRRGWWPRVGVIVNLTPAWRDPFTDGALVALVVTDGVLPEALPLAGDGGSDGPCLAILAALYTREPPATEDLETGDGEHAGLVTRLPADFGREPARFDADLAALRALTDERGVELRAAFEREQRLAARFAQLAERPFRDLTAPLSNDERAQVRRVLDARQELLAQLKAQGAAYRDTERKLAVAPCPSVSGPVVVERCDGNWRDRWVTDRLQLTLRPSVPIERVRVRGFIPPEAAERQRLTATLGGLTHRASAPSGELTWDLPLAAKANDPFTIEIGAGYAWTPEERGAARRLAWLLLGIEVR